MDEAKYEMRILPGITEEEIAEIVGKYDLEFKEKEHGPVFEGELEKLKKAAHHPVSMMVPAGLTETELKEAITQYDLKLEKTDYGPILHGEIVNLENARKYLVSALNTRIKKFTGEDKSED